MKKINKLVLLVAMGIMVAALGLFGCSSGSSSASASASASSASASSEASDSSASAEAAGDFTTLEEGKLIVATSPDFPPYESLDDAGQYVGLDMDIARAVAEKLGLEVEFKTLEFNGIIPAIAAGGQADMGISGITVDPERAKEVDFTEAYYIDNLAIVVPAGSAITAENAAEMLNSPDTVIAVQSGTSTEDYALENYPDATVQPYANATDCFAAAQSNNASAVCVNSAVATDMLKSAYADMQVVLQVATGEEYAIAVSKDNPGLTAAIDAILAEMLADGTIDNLQTTWLQ